MFYYQPPKGNSFGHALRPSDPGRAWPALTGFLGEFFEPSQPKSIELEVDPGLWSETEEQVEECRRRACAAFGRPAGNWTWHFGMDKHKEAIDFIVAGPPWPGGSASPLHLSFNYDLRWKPGVLPREVWLEPYSD